MEVSKINYVTFGVTLSDGSNGELKMIPSEPMVEIEHEALTKDWRDYDGSVLASATICRKLSINYGNAEWLFKCTE